ncbi:MAG: hypothetical protein R3286_00450 [Gammaproteobacteria bacterium]|nr:hypothetical protein [Gammaproteobacteria bacterium]
MNVEHAIAGNEVVKLFATPLLKRVLAPERRAALKAELLAHVDRLTAPLAPLGPGEQWHLPANLHRHAAFAPLRELAEGAALGLLERQRVIHQGIELTRCRAVVAAPGARLAKDASPNSYLSGICCVRGEIILRFADPRPHAGLILPPRRGGHPPCAESETLTVGEGTLVIVPAWLAFEIAWTGGDAHGTVLELDLMLSGYNQTISRPKWQGNRVQRQ